MTKVSDCKASNAKLVGNVREEMDMYDVKKAKSVGGPS